MFFFLSAAIVSVASVGSFVAPSPELGKAELTSVIQEQRVLLETFGFGFVATHDSPDGAHQEWRGWFIRAGSRWRVGYNYPPDGDAAAPLLRDITFNGGDKNIYLVGPLGAASVCSDSDFMSYTGEPAPGSRIGRLMLFWPSTPQDVAKRRDLVSLIARDDVTVATGSEAINGAACVRIDVPADLAQCSATIWVDPSRGCLPVRQRWSFHGGESSDLIDVVAFAQLESGAFVPTDVVITRSTGEAERYVMSDDNGVVPGGATSDVHALLPLDPFDLLPAGTKVHDLNSGTVFIAHAAALDRAVDSVLASVPARDASELRGRESRVLWIAGCSVLAGVAAFMAERRRAKSKAGATGPACG
ncbi:MAG: hypothetical protein SGJ09_10825 [Phycisphaerae bacterium]|nr:hypothetical protein [Phycisphaerae bacterium]